MLKSVQGIARQWSREKFAILTLKPRRHVRILIYRKWAIHIQIKCFRWVIPEKYARLGFFFIMCKLSENTRRFLVVQQTSLIKRLRLNCSYLGKVDKFSKPWFHLDSCIAPDQSPSLERVHQPQSNKASREWENNLQIWSYPQVSRVTNFLSHKSHPLYFMMHKAWLKHFCIRRRVSW